MSVLDEAKAALAEIDAFNEKWPYASLSHDGEPIPHPLLDVLRALVVEYETFTTEYRPGWIGDDGRARITSPATVHPDYVAEYRAEGGEVVRRLAGPWEVVEDAQ